MGKYYEWRVNTVNPKNYAYLGLIIVALVWGINYGVSRFALNHFDEAMFAFVRFGLSVPLFFLLMWRLEGSVKIKLKDALSFMVIGLFGVTALELMVMYSIRYTTLANASLLNVAPWPVFAALLTPLFMKETMTRQLAAGGAAAMAGVVFVILGGGQGFHLSSDTLRGDLLALGVSFLGALYNVACMPLMKRYSPLKVSGWVTLFGVIFMFPFTIGSWGKVDWSGLGLAGISALAYNVLICTVAAIFLWNLCMQKVGAARSNFFRYAVPAAAILAGYLFYGEAMGVWQWFGGVLMAAGLIWISKERSSPVAASNRLASTE